ncbi:MAG: hypothetical protein KF726_20540, partial [Anaerolineae bacterium]|nr:hypothetical protein [Anaerolineae bacterium]
LDWLWLAGKVSSLPERIYCYRRALYIDPNSVVARQGLELLTNQHHKSSFSLRFLSAILGKTESPVRAG